jgi:hypothetical protein
MDDLDAKLTDMLHHRVTPEDETFTAFSAYTTPPLHPHLSGRGLDSQIRKL